jgi:ATP-dependent helicase/nuclease subunit B
MRSRVIATGYGAQALTELRKVVAEAKSDDPMAPVTLLLPNNIAGIVARRHLARGLTHDGNGVAGLYLATLPRLAEQFASPALTPRRPASRPMVASAWRVALDRDPGIFTQVKDHPATIRALTGAYRELRDLSDEALDTIAGYSALSADLVRLHRDVTASLATDWYDETDLLHKAAEIARAHPDNANERGSLVLYLPQALTRAESAFTAALGEHCDLTVIAGLTWTKRGDAAVRRTLTRIGAEQPEPSAKAPTAHRVLHASDSDDEVRCVVRDVVAALRTTPAHRIAVLYGSATPYARLVHEHLAASKIAFNGPGTRAVHERALTRGLLGVLALPDVAYGRGEMFQALAEAPTRDFAGDRVPVSRWERVSRSAGVVRGSDWTTRLRTYAGEQRGTADEEERGDDPRPGVINRARNQAESAEALQAFVTRLRERLDHGATLTTWSELSGWALELFHNLYGEAHQLLRLPSEEQYAAAAVEQTLRGLAGLDAFEPTAMLQRLREVLDLEVETALPRVGRFGEGVFVGPVSAAIGLDVDQTFVLGLAEDAYPGRLHEDALLPDRVRRLTDKLDAAHERLDTKQRHLLAAFETAPYVTASFPRGDLRRSTERLPSRFLLPTLRALTGYKDLVATEWHNHAGDAIVGSDSYAATLRETETLASEQEWRIRTASVGHDLADDAVAAAVALIRERSSDDFTRFDGNLQRADGLPDYVRGEQAVSPTALEAYADCPHAYFMQRMLGVEPLEQPEEVITISPLEIGTLVHDAMDALVTAYADRLPSYGEEWTPQQKRRLQQIAEAKADEFEARGVTGHPRLWQRERIRILADLAWMLDDDFAYRVRRNAEVVASEMAFGMHGEDPVEIAIPGGRVLMRGSADRVDRTKHGTILVTDIKTGSTRKYEVLKKDLVGGGTRLQLPVYAHAARQKLGDRTTDVEAAYWFVRGKDRGKRIPVDLATVETPYAQALGTIVSSIAAGLFPARPPKDDDYGYVRCAWCNPDGVGYGDARSRWERKRLGPALREYVGLVQPDVLPNEGADA